MHNQSLERALCILHLEQTGASVQIATITDLTTTFGVKRRAIQHNQGLLRRADTLYFRAIYHQRHHFAAAGDTFVACEFSWAGTLQDSCQGAIILRACKRAGSPAALLLALHSLFET